MLPLFLAIDLVGCSPNPDAIPGCQINEEPFGATRRAGARNSGQAGPVRPEAGPGNMTAPRRGEGGPMDRLPFHVLLSWLPRSN
jgi:hypothetical protein